MGESAGAIHVHRLIPFPFFFLERFFFFFNAYILHHEFVKLYPWMRFVSSGRFWRNMRTNH